MNRANIKENVGYVAIIKDLGKEFNLYQSTGI